MGQFLEGHPVMSTAQKKARSVPEHRPRWVLFSFVFTISFLTAAETSDELQWSIVPSPVKTNLNRLYLNSSGEGYAVGKYLLQCRNGVWSMTAGLPWTSDVNTLQMIAPNSVYCSTLEPTNESFLYHFDGHTWNRTAHPLANFITSINFNARGIGWLGGWGQMAFYNGKDWRMYPPLPNVTSVLGIIGTTYEDVVIHTGGMAIYRLADGKWKEMMPAESLHAFLTTGSRSALAVFGTTVYELNGTTWNVHSASSLLGGITSLNRERNGTIWGVGEKGMLVRFDGTEWKWIPLSTEEQLNDISVNGKEGFIIGDNGTILRLGKTGHDQKRELSAGFRVERIFYSGKGLDGEYGAAIEDLNGDGLKDLYTVNLYNQNLLFINRYGTGTLFRDETMMRGASGGEADTTVYTIRDIDQGVGAADLDNDGDRELFLCSLVGHNSLLLNKGDGYFHDVSHQERRGIFPSGRSNSVSFVDADNDGDLDMFVANEMTTNRLFLNNGGGYFSDITASSGLTTERGGISSTFGDMDRDGRADLIVTFWTDQCRFYKNISTKDDGIRFVDMTERSGIGGNAYDRSNGVAAGDIDNDGDLDLFIAKRKSPNMLFRNDGEGTFTNISAAAIGSDTLISYGVCIADLNNDGWQDIYLSNVGANRFYLNNRNGTFTDKTFEFGLQHVGYNTGIAAGDVDNDGDIDLYTSTYINGESRLFLNNINDSNSIAVTVEGTISNRDGVGAIVRLYDDGKAGVPSSMLQSREVNSGSGYASHNSLEVHFGASKDRTYDLVVTFPASGISRTIHHVAGGSRLTVNEEKDAQRIATLSGKFLVREMNDPSTQFEALKFIVMLLLSAVSVRFGNRRSGWGHSMQAAVHIPVILLFIGLTSVFHYEVNLLYAYLPIIISLTIYTLIHLYHERVSLKRSAQRERENTRKQIARDLHDDIASTLSSATIYLNVLQHSFKRRTAQQNELLKKVNEAIGAASEGMTDIIWAIAPKHDTLGDLIARIRIMIAESASAHSLEAELRIADTEEHLSISEIARRNIYLIFKEGMTNIHKHASAHSVIFSVVHQNKRIVFTLTDDGRGIPADLRQQKNEEELLLHGNGIGNMKHRAEEIGAEFILRTAEGGGSELQLSVEMIQLHH
jgi:signal transduction histidine kinase